MLTEVKNQFKISILSVKYALMREMLNKVSFIFNIVFMILNNATFIIEWIIFYSLKDNFGGYTFKMVLLLWAISASTYGFAHFFFKNSFNLHDTINNGKLDSYLVQPKNVLLSCITTDVEPSALGDIIYGFIMLLIYGFTMTRFVLFILFTILGGITITAFAVILSSLSFWINKSDVIADMGNGFVTSFSTYPSSIFKGIVKLILYTIIPVGISTYVPVSIINNFDIKLFIIVILTTLLFVFVSFLVFYKGLKRYSSSNLMSARI